MVYLVNSHTDATSKRWHLWEIGSDLPSTRLQGGGGGGVCLQSARNIVQPFQLLNLISSNREHFQIVCRVEAGLLRKRRLQVPG